MPARILIIEDNPANLDLMTYLLKAFGHVPMAPRTASRAWPPPGARNLS